MSAAFVGREDLLGPLRSAAARAARGSGGLHLLVGDPGIGKTRLAEEIASILEGEGFRTVWGAAWEGEGAPPLWPWIRGLRPLVDEGGAPEEAAALTRLLPDLAPGRSPGPAEDATDARFRLFDAIQALLGAAADERPLLVVLDDLHCADRTSLLLLRFVAGALRGHRVLILALSREPEPDVRGLILGDLARLGTTRLLRALTVEETGAMIAEITGAEPGEEVAARVQARTGGNPFFVRELAVAAGIEGIDSAAIPATAAEAIARRTAALSSDAASVLEAAAVLGAEFEPAIASAVVGEPSERIDGLLVESESVGMIRPLDGGRWRFGHELMREALYAAIPRQRRAELHRRTAAALRERQGGVEEVAHHMGRAPEVFEPSEVLDAVRAAAASALERLAYEDAASHLERALRIEREIDPAEPERRARLLLDLGGARYRAGRVREAREAFLEAASVARANGQIPLLTESALGFQALGSFFSTGVPDDDLISLLEEALAALPAGDGSERARLLSRLAWETPDVERRHGLAAEAADMARRLDDPAALGTALLSLRMVSFCTEPVEDRAEISAEIEALAARTGDPDMAVWVRLWRIVDLLELGRMDEADREIDAFDRQARRFQTPLYSAWPRLWQAMRTLQEGRFEEGAALAADAAAVGQLAHGERAEQARTSQMLLILDEQDRLDEIERIARAGVGALPMIPGYRARLALTLAQMGREAEARAEWERLAADDFGVVRRDPTWWLVLAILAEVCALLGDAERAPALYRLLSPHRGRVVLGPFATLSRGPTDRYLGLLAAAQGRWSDAERHFETALEVCRRIGSRPWAAHTRYDLARMLRQGHGDDDRAAELLDDAVREAEDLGMARLARLARDAGGGEGPSEPPAGDAMFRRDGDVWTLGFDDETARMRDSKGLRDIAILLERPGAEVHVLDLVAATEGTVGGDRGAPDEGLHVDAGSREGRIDDTARARYVARAEQLRSEIEDAEDAGDAGRTARAREELEAIASELAAGYGLGGRPRPAAGDRAERARKAVATRIRYTLDRLRKEAPALARHLDRSIRTGTFCSYEPERPTTWRL